MVMQADGDSGLLFAGGSHRDFALPFWRDPAAEALDSRGYQMASPGRMALGDVSWHAGMAHTFRAFGAGRHAAY